MAVVDAIVEIECEYSALPRAISQLISGVSKRRFTVIKRDLRLRDDLLVSSSKPEHILIESV